MPKLSKHKKKSWRKQIDLNEFEEYFEDQRLGERVGYVLNLLSLLITDSGFIANVPMISLLKTKGRILKTLLKTSNRTLRRN